jgi:hypothetical protein
MDTAERLPGQVDQAEFWIPKSMRTNWQFVSGKVREVERSLPFAGAKVQGL